jgi:DNA-binding CsgD family transcriptional regulator
MENLRVLASDRTRFLAHLGLDALVLDADRRLLAPAAAPGVCLPSPFTLLGGRATVADTEQQAAFAAGAALALRHLAGWKTLGLVGRETRILLLHDSIGGTSVLVAVRSDRHLDNRVCPVCLRNAFGLSEREAALAAMLGTGRPIAAAARRLQMSLATARTHLRHIFLMVGIESQNELVARVAASAFGLCPGAQAANGCACHG